MIAFRPRLVVRRTVRRGSRVSPEPTQHEEGETVRVQAIDPEAFDGRVGDRQDVARTVTFP
jgi:hypothetical protein